MLAFEILLKYVSLGSPFLWGYIKFLREHPLALLFIFLSSDTVYSTLQLLSFQSYRVFWRHSTAHIEATVNFS